MTSLVDIDVIVSRAPRETQATKMQLINRLSPENTRMWRRLYRLNNAIRVKSRRGILNLRQITIISKRDVPPHEWDPAVYFDIMTKGITEYYEIRISRINDAVIKLIEFGLRNEMLRVAQCRQNSRYTSRQH